MLINNRMQVNKYDANQGLVPMQNSKILISDNRDDKYAKTICINIMGLTKVLPGNKQCDF